MAETFDFITVTTPNGSVQYKAPPMAAEFSASTNYAAGDYCTYQGALYRFSAAHAAGAWIGTDAAVVSLAGDVSDLRSAIDLGSITVGIKDALIAAFNHVAWDDDDPTGQTYIDALYDALYNRYWDVTNTLSHCASSNAAEHTIKGNPYSATITASAGYTLTGATVSVTMGGVDITSTVYSNGVISIPAVTGALVITVTAAALEVTGISAVYTQSGTVYDTDSLDSLKDDLVVTATLEDSSTVTVPSADYTLSGTLSAGTSTITVTFREKTDTFTVTVTTSLLLNDILTLDGIQNTRSGHNASSTKWEDLSGNSRDFSKYRTNVLWNDDSAVFNGSNTGLTYSGVLFPSTLTEFTVEISIKIGAIGTSTNGYPVLVDNTSTWAQRDDFIAIINNGNKCVQVAWGIGGNIAVGDNIAHVTFVFKSDGNCYRYLNGESSTTYTYAYSTSAFGRTTHYIGTATSGNQYFTGEIYRIGISSTALSDEEIASRYTALASRFG